MRTNLSARGGAAVLEFAIVAPLLFLLIFGIVEFGRAMMVMAVITNSARAGARAGAITSGDYTAIKTAVENTLKRGSVQAVPGIEVQVNGATVTSDASYRDAALGGAAISVQVSIPFAQVSWLPSGGFFLSQTILAETVVMRREG